MAARGFWSKLFGKGGPEDEPDPQPGDRDTPPSPQPGPEAADRPQRPDAPIPPANTPAPDETPRMSGSTRPSFATDAVSATYAQALYELAQSNGSLADVTQEIEQLAELLAANPDLVTLIAGRALGRDARAGLIDRVFKGKINDTLHKFLHVLNRKDRLASLPGVTASFAGIVAENAGIIEVDAYVASRLDDATADQVARSIGAALGGKQVVLHQYVDASLIGGLKIRVGDQLIDGSVATRLTKMKRDLIAAGREKARTAELQD